MLVSRKEFTELKKLISDTSIKVMLLRKEMDLMERIVSQLCGSKGSRDDKNSSFHEVCRRLAKLEDRNQDKESK